ncbi:MAG TPA: hypothetical protein VEY67_05300 [Candidatus Dormibacteraeota bacterium]|nr:hypothetical protein [Candidatus Dormibacteraeota bacterium]
MSNKYVLVYRGGGMPEGEEAQRQVLAAWEAWFGRLGGALADPGNPASRSRSIASDGSVSAEGRPTISGYSILSAGTLDEAVELAKGCPVLTSGASIEVVEAPDMM